MYIQIYIYICSTAKTCGSQSIAKDRQHAMISILCTDASVAELHVAQMLLECTATGFDFRPNSPPTPARIDFVAVAHR